MWTFVHKVATSRFPGTKASAATAETCKRYFQEAWAKREKDLWGSESSLNVRGCRCRLLQLADTTVDLKEV